jgi:hypothetical protein
MQARGKFEEARVLLGEVLAARERVLGPDHPDTLASRNNLANVMQARGKFEEARVLLGEVLAARERVLGPDHPDTLWSRPGWRCRAARRPGVHDYPRTRSRAPETLWSRSSLLELTPRLLGGFAFVHPDAPRRTRRTKKKINHQLQAG